MQSTLAHVTIASCPLSNQRYAEDGVYWLLHPSVCHWYLSRVESTHPTDPLLDCIASEFEGIDGLCEDIYAKPAVNGRTMNKLSRYLKFFE
jgi:hypothetical protein